MAPRGVPWPSRGVPWPLYEEYGLEDPYYIYSQFIYVTLLLNNGSFQQGRQSLIKSLYEQKRYNAWQFIIEFPNKDWTKNSINRMLLKLRNMVQSTGVRAAACNEVRTLIKTLTSLVLSLRVIEQRNGT